MGVSVTEAPFCMNEMLLLKVEPSFLAGGYVILLFLFCFSVIGRMWTVSDIYFLMLDNVNHRKAPIYNLLTSVFFLIEYGNFGREGIQIDMICSFFLERISKERNVYWRKIDVHLSFVMIADDSVLLLAISLIWSTLS